MEEVCILARPAVGGQSATGMKAQQAEVRVGRCYLRQTVEHSTPTGTVMVSHITCTYILTASMHLIQPLALIGLEGGWEVLVEVV